MQFVARDPSDEEAVEAARIATEIIQQPHVQEMLWKAWAEYIPPEHIVPWEEE